LAFIRQDLLGATLTAGRQTEHGSAQQGQRTRLGNGARIADAATTIKARLEKNAAGEFYLDLSHVLPPPADGAAAAGTQSKPQEKSK